nr:immunoglobulin light chain junction region [Macaca mulatta]MOX70059.1 immunoglobulin light chain junction region [Macaca mulatta]MOX70097.1 immunoglobulin light chain junction region [Macaca mulatta]MOX70959.1 immunoglobulin light chain junction region [Macaca mulatta]MOX71116.1 immunoglobulin light chain junction region [Macaca mulatta]
DYYCQAYDSSLSAVLF